MKINELLKKRPTLSFEIFPPKNNENDLSSIYATIDELPNTRTKTKILVWSKTVESVIKG